METDNRSEEILVFPFLSLPLELRRLIYRYLVPNVDVASHPMPSRFTNPASITHIRADGQICTPGILGVSKQIYDEAITEFYGCGRFQLSVVKRGGMTIDFLGHGYLFDDDLPPVFDRVRSLKITMKANVPPRPKLSHEIDYIFRRLFLRSERSALEVIHLEFVSDTSFWSSHMADRNLTMLPDSLEPFVCPLKEVRGLKVATAEFNLYAPYFGSENRAPLQVSSIGQSEIKKSLDELTELMTMPRSRQAS